MNKKGQSIIEYGLITILVILGIVFMGPYVLRSINAHFKLWDTGVQDSFTEVLTNAPVNDVPDINTKCSYKDTPGSCGGTQSGLQCAGNERMWNHQTDPQLCDGEPPSFCKPDDGCCLTYSSGNCGTSPILAVPDTTPPPLPGTILPNGSKVPQGIQYPAGATWPGIISTTTAPPNCYYGQRIYGTQCADLPAVCGPDPTGQCAPTCLGQITFSGSAVYCPGATTGLDQDYSTTYVADGTPADAGLNCTGAKCQAYCNPPYSLNSLKDGCEPVYTVAPVLNSCPPNSSSYCSNGGAGCGDEGNGQFCSTVKDSETFTICTTDTDYVVTAASSPGNGCGPQGIPGTTCTVTVTYASANCTGECPVPGSPSTYACTVLNTDNNNCGSCGNVCATGNTCCGGACTDLTSDVNNCGACGNTCAKNKKCKSGVCS